jgi:hypothetical protein
MLRALLATVYATAGDRVGAERILNDSIAPERKKTRKRLNAYGVMIRGPWAWVELNYRPHAYQAASYEHELGSEVPTRLPFTNILLSISRI